MARRPLQKALERHGSGVVVRNVQARPRQDLRRWRPAGAGAAVAVLLAAPLLASCGGGSSAPQFDRKAAPAAIQRVYGVLFDFSEPSVSDKVAVVENGGTLRSALREALSSPLASMATGAKVTRTTLLGTSACKDAGVASPCARVRYDILGTKGSVLFRGSSGYAVYDGTWLVAHATICGLLTTMYQTLGKKGTPEGC